MARLVCDPFNVPFRDLGRLTISAMYRIYFWERDSKGGLVPPPDDNSGQQKFEEQFRDLWKERGASPEQIEKLWAALKDHEQKKRSEAISKGIADLTGAILNGQAWAAMEEEYVLRWREVAKGIMEHGK